MLFRRQAIAFLLFVVIPLFWLLDPVRAQSYGGAYTVDGNISEWNLTDDYFESYYKSGMAGLTVGAKLYLHMDPSTGILYGLMLREPGFVGLGSDDHITLKLVSAISWNSPTTQVNYLQTGNLAGIECMWTGMTQGTYDVYFQFKVGTTVYYGPPGTQLTLAWLDLEVEKTVDNATPNIGDQVSFTVTVTNHSTTTDATSVNLWDRLPANLVYNSVVSGSLSHTLHNGNQDINLTAASIGANSSKNFIFKVDVNGSADNTAAELTVGQYDTNSTNNSSTVSVSASGSSGGGGGGIESNGDLAVKMAWRNFVRIKEDTRPRSDTRDDLPVFSENLARKGIITVASKTKIANQVLDYIPEIGPFKSQAHVSTPDDLLTITNASAIFSADYYDPSGRRYGALMAMITNNEVYDHTKLVCDRLNGGELTKRELVEVRGIPMILTRLVQESGEIDYAISFISFVRKHQFNFDSRWHPSSYSDLAGCEVLNFQIWSVTRQSTLELTERVLDRMAIDYPVKSASKKPVEMPKLYVSSGSYQSDQLQLNIMNPDGAETIELTGKKTLIEGGETIPFSYTIHINPAEPKQRIELDIGTLFDAVVVVNNNLDQTPDYLYFSDGAWALDHLPGGAIVESFVIKPGTLSDRHAALTLNRNIKISGQVKNYLSVFRTLRASGRPSDCSEMNYLSFEASGYGNCELVIVREKIGNWASQYRIPIQLDAEEKLYQIKLNDYLGFEDVESVVFSFLGDGYSETPFSFELKNLQFESLPDQLRSSDLSNFYLSVYPNPVADYAQVAYELEEAAEVQIEILNGLGQVVEVLAHSTVNKGNQVKQFDLGHLSAGTYCIRLWVGDLQAQKLFLKR